MCVACRASVGPAGKEGIQKNALSILGRLLATMRLPATLLPLHACMSTNSTCVRHSTAHQLYTKMKVEAMSEPFVPQARSHISGYVSHLYFLPSENIFDSV